MISLFLVPHRFNAVQSYFVADKLDTNAIDLEFLVVVDVIPVVSAMAKSICPMWTDGRSQVQLRL